MALLPENPTLLDGFIDEGPIVAAHEPFIVLDQSIDLDFDFLTKTIRGKTTIKIWITTSDEPESIRLDARQCDINTRKVTVNGAKVRATYRDPCKLMDTPVGYNWGVGQHALRSARVAPVVPTRKVELPLSERERVGCMPADGSLRVWLRAPEKAVEPGSARIGGAPRIKLKRPSTVIQPAVPSTFTIEIPFETKQARDGYHFVGVDPGDMRYPHLYTRHSLEPGMAGCVFPCVDDRMRVNEWNLSLRFPRTVGDVLAPKASESTDGQHDRDSTLVEEDKILEMTAICAGTLVGERIDAVDSSKRIMQFQATSCGAHHVGFSIGPFESVDMYSAFRLEEDDEKLKQNAVKIHGYCLPGRADEVRNTAAAMATAADFFVLTFAKYPFDSYKFCFVDDLIEDTVPLQAFSLCTSRLLAPGELIDNEIETTRTLIHTLATQYFGIHMNPDQRSDSWIVIGLSWFMTDLCMKKLCGNNHYRFQMRMSADRLVEADVGRPCLQDLGEYLVFGNVEMDFMVHKAPLVIYILDRRLLKASNTAGVTRVVSGMLRDAFTAMDLTSSVQYLISSEKFRKSCEKRGRLRLESFWDQWVVGAGCPLLDLNQRFNKKKLEVEITVNQEQHQAAQQQHLLAKDNFWRDLVEEQHHVYASEVPLTFTGPMTFRVHEADGTPYEHCLEIKLDAIATKGSRLQLPYNTKYKRIKKVRQRKKEKAAAVAKGDAGERPADEEREDEEGVDVNMLGDVLMAQEDMDSWRLVDWDEAMQQQMDQESYEWIRVDCDFEWIFRIKTNLQIYMTISQLQQDRDIAAQVEALLKLSRNNPSNIQTTVLLRTLYDNKYYPGIRQMAANVLTKHSHPTNNWRGMQHLMRTFQTFYCFPNTSMPRPNDFSSRQEYMVQSIIPLAIANVRGGEDECPLVAREFILDQLIYNNNEDNAYSDHIYVAKLLEALAVSMVRTKTKNQSRYEDSQERVDFRTRAYEQIERYRRMDEWVSSYQNIWTTAALDAKQKLMKSGVIEVDALDFVQYLNDETLDVVQIKAWECLVELHLFLKPVILKLFLASIRTHSSPFIRDRLFKAFTKGLAAIALGEYRVQEDPKPAAQQQEEDDEGDILLEEADDIIAQRQLDLARQHDIYASIKALREAVQDNQLLQTELWKTLDSDLMGIAEKRNMLDICGTLFEEDDSMWITLKQPTRWRVTRGLNVPGKKLVMEFKSSIRTSPRKGRYHPRLDQIALELHPELAPLEQPRVEQRKVIKLAVPRRTSVSGPKFVNGDASRANSLLNPALVPAASARPSPTGTAPAMSPIVKRGDSVAPQRPLSSVPMASAATKTVANGTSNGHGTGRTTLPKKRKATVDLPVDDDDSSDDDVPLSARQPAAAAAAAAVVAQQPPRKMVKLTYSVDKRSAEQSATWSTHPSRSLLIPDTPRAAISYGEASINAGTLTPNQSFTFPQQQQQQQQQQTSPVDGTKPARKPLPSKSSSHASNATSPVLKTPGMASFQQPTPDVSQANELDLDGGGSSFTATSALPPTPVSRRPTIKINFNKRSSTSHASPPAGGGGGGGGA